MSSYQYRKSHFGDKTILRPSYLYNGISYNGKKTSLYWIGAQLSSYPCQHIEVDAKWPLHCRGHFTSKFLRGHCIATHISLKYASAQSTTSIGLDDAWHLTSEKLLFQTIMTQSNDKCVTRPRCVDKLTKHHTMLSGTQRGNSMWASGKALFR